MAKAATQDFQSNVYKLVKLIPEGRVTSYGAIAKAIGVGSSSRMVGWALKQPSCQKLKVPAHRVVNRNGVLTGKHSFKPPSKMEKLLKKEGVNVKNDKIVDFKSLLWDPLKELVKPFLVSLYWQLS